MALTVGTRLGPYEITDAVGAGGMGEVYKARDTRLGRTVALKILPADFASDVDRRQRFEREARVIASLSHPNICALHDVGSASSENSEGSLAYLVMEYLEGETLAERLTRGPLPLDQVSRFGHDIAMALDAAHRQHVVHRDLKPGNIMLTRTGVKLLDFGLARSSATVSDADSLTTYAVSGVTAPGTVLGTLPYMSPEQVEGRAVDARSDIFALGAVLYEMATGHRAFPGSSPASVAAAVLSTNPRPVDTSPELDRIITTCLDKDCERRWQSAYDVAVQLAALSERDAAAARQRPVRRAWLPWTVAAGSVLAAIVTLAWTAARGRETAAAVGAPRDRMVALPIAPPSGGAFSQFVEWLHFAISPDGNTVAYSARSADARVRIWLRSLSSITARPLEGTDGATSMFWSPDGRSLAFFAGGRLMRMDLPDGAPFPICKVVDSIGLTGTWGADGQILFASVQGEVLYSIQASGGTPTELRRPDPKRGELRLVWPTFLPDGRRYLYLAAHKGDTGAVMLAGGAEPREVLRVKSNVQYINPGYLLFVNDSALVARRFDPDSGALSGDPIAIAERVSYFRATGIAHFAASPNGIIVYQQFEDERRIASFDRSGRELAEIRPPAYYQSMRFSPDERRLLYDRADRRLTTLDAWVLDLARGTERPVTHEPTTEAFPIWGPDDTIIYASVRGGPPHVVRRNVETEMEEQLSASDATAHFPLDVSPNGEWLIFGRRAVGGHMDLLARRLTDPQIVPFRTSPANEHEARFSPDGRFVAFVTTETGSPQVVVAPFPRGAGAPIGAGRTPRWSSDGRELFYIGPDRELMSASISLTPLEIGKSGRLFPARAADGAWVTFEVTRDGRFFAIVGTRVAAEQPLTAVVNWRSR